MQANGRVLNDKSVALKMRANRRHSFHALGFMDSTIASPGGNTIATLRRVAQAGRTEERCDLCSLTLAPTHRHLLEVSRRQIVCACDGCALRFQSVIGGRFKLIPRDATALPDFDLTDHQWESLAIPINLAFLFHNSVGGKMTAMYPSPAGATESLLSLHNWEMLTASNPRLAKLEPDVEALLVNRVGNAREYFIAPIDRCYALVGLIRADWRGFTGGEIVWEKINQFFAQLRQECRVSIPPQEATYAGA